MNIFDQLNIYLFSIGNNDILLSYVLKSLLAALTLIILFIIVKRRYFPRYVASRSLGAKEQKRLALVFGGLLFLVWLTITFLAFELDFSIHEFDSGFDLRFSTFLKIFLVYQIASFIIRLAVETIQHRYTNTVSSKPTDDERIRSTKTSTGQIRALVILLATLVLLDMLHLDYTLFNLNEASIKVSGILMAAVLLIGARILGWIMTEIVLASYYGRSQSKKLDEGNRYAINRLLSYFIYTLAFLFALSAIGLNLTLLWGGAAALLVGVGLGLQQTFNDVFSGILLLFERSVEVGDWVEMQSSAGVARNGRRAKASGITRVGRVTQIGLRTSVVKGRDDISMIVPNSILVTQNVINWSHHDTRTRFSVEVLVAYGSDTKLVKKLLEEVANNHSRVLEKPHAKVRLVQFGDNGLHFQVLFWARHFYSIEDIKSDIRFGIDDSFRKNGISIPFPQRDVWMRKD